MTWFSESAIYNICGGPLTVNNSEEVYILSPGAPGQYYRESRQNMGYVPRSCNMSWIPPERAKYVRIEVIHMDLPYDVYNSGDCPSDRIEVTQGTKYIGTFCGECYFTKTTPVQDNSNNGNKNGNNSYLSFHFVVTRSGRYHTGFIIKITGESSIFMILCLFHCYGWAVLAHG